MCNFASFVITKDSVFWSQKTDSHQSIFTIVKHVPKVQA